MPAVTSAFATAVARHKAGRLDEAEALYLEILAREPANAPAAHALGVARLERGKYALALEAFDKAVAARKDVAGYHNDRAEALRALGRQEEAIASYRAALRADPKFALAHVNLGVALQAKGEAAAAERSYRRAIALAPNDAQAHHYLGTALAQQGETAAAIKSYRRALTLDMRNAPVHNDLGIALERTGDTANALRAFQRAIELDPTFATAYENTASLLQGKGDSGAAVMVYRRMVEALPVSRAARLKLGDALFGGRDQAGALAEYEHALRLAPGSLGARLRLCIARLPAVYSEDGEISACRERYRAELKAIAAECRAPTQLRQVADAMTNIAPFYLPAQGENDCDLQATFGDVATRAFGAEYPLAPPSRSRRAQDRIRVGIVASTFRNHTVWKIMIRGWAETIDRRRFSLIAYNTRSYVDDETQRACGSFDKFVQGPLSVQQWARRIKDDAIDVLIFPEIGMDPGLLPLAALRHAPVQCASWGHPSTTGLATIDYFLGSDLMEPEDARQHYTEQLIRLPNLGIYYRPDYFAAGGPAPADLARAQQMLSLAPGEILYWSCQAAHKYLPQHDDIYPTIARRVPVARFAFIVSERDTLLRRRLEEAFSRYGLSAAKHCIFLPLLSPQLFAAVSKSANVYLDTLGWSGCTTTLENLAYDTPMVTLLGRLMRERHTAAMLTMAGVTDTITRSKDDYIEIAAKLGNDAAWRQEIATQMAVGKARVYADLAPVRALEQQIEGWVAA